MSKMIDSVIFDLDGTLWDATSVTAETWVEVLGRHPDITPAQPLDSETIKKYMGLTNEALAEILFPTLPFDEALALMQESCELENKWLPERGGVLYPKVCETLDELREMGVRLFIVSNCQDGYIESFLTAHGMYDRFDDWECSGCTGKSKAENIAEIIERNSLKSPIYVGDTVSDSVGARGAGIPFVYCRYGFGETYGRGKTDDFDAAIDEFSWLPAIVEEFYYTEYLNIALLQLMPTGTLDGNLKKGLSACAEAKKMGADIALFPEMWSCGYNFSQDKDELMAQSISADSDFVRKFGEIAAELDMAVGVTILEQYEPSPRNTLILFDRHGERVLTYAKVHTCDFGDERVLTAGDDFPVVSLDTAIGGVKVGAMICYDREFPESARILMLKGAEIILTPNACPMEINRLSQLRGRAYENMLGVATCNYPEGQPDCNGHSSAFDGVAYLPELSGSRDTCILEAGGEEGIYMAKFDMTMIREYRSSEVHGNAYRRPEMYGILLDKEVKEPFIRSDRR